MDFITITSIKQLTRAEELYNAYITKTGKMFVDVKKGLLPKTYWVEGTSCYYLVTFKKNSNGTGEVFCACPATTLCYHIWAAYLVHSGVMKASVAKVLPEVEIVKYITEEVCMECGKDFNSQKLNDFMYCPKCAKAKNAEREAWLNTHTKTDSEKARMYRDKKAIKPKNIKELAKAQGTL